MTKTHLGVAVVLWLTLGACSNDFSTSNATKVPPSRLVASHPGRRTINDDYSDFVDQVPGFGGMFQDGNGNLTVFLKDPAILTTVRTALSNFVRTHLRGVGASQIRAIHGLYDFRELNQWYLTLKATVSFDGINETEIDNRQNRLHIGVIDASTAARAMRQAIAAGIPAGAVITEVTKPVIRTSSLHDDVRPVIGGLRIYDRPSGEYCTLGAVVRPYVLDYLGHYMDSTHTYFITAAHCTDSIGVVHGDTMAQSTTTRAIGREVADPTPFDHSTDYNCPVGKKCRYSDAALFVLDTTYDFSGIAIPTSGTTYSSVSHYDSVSLSVPSTGVTNYRVGQAYGIATHTLVSSCADYANGSVWMVCQRKMSGDQAIGGDSGGPVFTYGPDGAPMFEGIEWGIQAGGYTYYSSGYYIAAELNPYFTNLIGRNSWMAVCDHVSLSPNYNQVCLPEN